MMPLRGWAMILGLSLTTAFAQAQTIGPLTALSASPSSASQRSPVGVWDGNQYVILWEDGRSTTNGLELYLARISADGNLLDSNGIRAWDSPLAADQSDPSIAFNASANNVIYAWTDPRSGGTQIYAARFDPQGTGLLLDGTGFAVSSGPNTHAYPSLDCTAQSCLVAFQQAGSSEVFGRRIASNGSFHDGASMDLVMDGQNQNVELSVRVLARNNDFVVAWEDDRNGNSANLGADLFFGLVPELTTVSPLAGLILVSANFRQTAPSLANGSTDNGFWSVWQDQRAGNMDVWLGRYDSSGAQIAQAALTQRSSNQVFGSLARGNSNALVVWEDFRTAYGSIYAVLLDGSGNQSSTGAFFVMGFLGNAIEQVVIKGPNNDFLIMAVQSTPSPARVYYRIIRDEDPTGTLSSANAQAPADGVSTANINFGPVTGASGFEVVDGTLFTVSFPSGFNINVADADSSVAGHQVPSVNGRVQFGLSTTTVGTLFVSIASVRGNASGVGMATFSNVAPTIGQIELTPSTPSAADDIVLSYVYADLNNDSEGTTEITWTKGNITQGAYNNLRTVPASATSPSDRWRAMVRPHDGTDYGSIGFSNILVVAPNPGSNIGNACTINSDCNSGYCTDNVCCENRCGGGGIDCQACSIASGSAANGSCQAVAVGTVCRPEYGDCDLAELCDGNSTACPANRLESVGTVCRAAAGHCDDIEYCNGFSPSCPADSVMSAQTPCRGRMGSCDLPEFCDGSSALCPENNLISANTVCRNASGPCDEAETCDGQNGACPDDQMFTAGTVCRVALGDCDNTEACDGSNALCPIDTKKTIGETCRPAAADCDKEEVCDGLTTACPDDQIADSSRTCRAKTGDCDQPESCDGVNPTCPLDVLAAAQTECRAAQGVCDPAETCSGDTAECPSDIFAIDGTSCDDQEACTSEDECRAGQCKGQVQTCMEPKPDAGIDTVPMLKIAEEPKSILNCKCQDLSPQSRPENSLSLLMGLFFVGLIRARSRDPQSQRT